ncbi:MAG: Lrp/AsnC family transcriptional regulator [bacterium]|nr:Lrp/AsnC family transcriptional regulator [bacterium]
MIDATDRQILSIVQDNARINNADIARQVGMAPSATLERLRKLEKRGVVSGYQARLDPDAIGLGLLAFVFVRTNESMAESCTGDALARLPEVQEVHHVAGEDCYLVKVRAESTEALGRLLRQKLGEIPSVLSTHSTIVLETIKESGLLPLEAAVGGRDED